MLFKRDGCQHVQVVHAPPALSHAVLPANCRAAALVAACCGWRSAGAAAAAGRMAAATTAAAMACCRAAGRGRGGGLGGPRKPWASGARLGGGGPQLRWLLCNAICNGRMAMRRLGCPPSMPSRPCMGLGRPLGASAGCWIAPPSRVGPFPLPPSCSRRRDQPCRAARAASRPSWITSSSASRACWGPRRRWAGQTSGSAQIARR